MKPRSVFPRAVALVSLLVAALCVGCGSDGPLAPVRDAEVIGILEKVDTRGGEDDAYLLIRTTEMDGRPSHSELLRLNHLE
jgi:hypothetical protein